MSKCVTCKGREATTGTKQCKNSKKIKEFEKLEKRNEN